MPREITNLVLGRFTRVYLGDDDVLHVVRDGVHLVQDKSTGDIVESTDPIWEPSP